MGSAHHEIMSEEQLAALLTKLKDDAGLREKLQCATDLDAAISLAKEAGFDVCKADLQSYQAEQALEVSDEELETAAGGCTGNTGKVITMKAECGTKCYNTLPCY